MCADTDVFDPSLEPQRNTVNNGQVGICLAVGLQFSKGKKTSGQLSIAEQTHACPESNVFLQKLSTSVVQHSRCQVEGL